jgi:hypothetical protein
MEDVPRAVPYRNTTNTGQTARTTSGRRTICTPDVHICLYPQQNENNISVLLQNLVKQGLLFVRWFI